MRNQCYAAVVGIQRLALRQCPALVILFTSSIVTLALGGTMVAKEPSQEVAAIIRGMRESHQRLLHVPGGIAFRYHLDVEQDKDRPRFAFIEGLNGYLGIKWPVLRSRVEGDMAGITVYEPGKGPKSVIMPMIREASFDFETGTSVAREGKLLGQIADFRHTYSAQFSYPLRMQFFIEMDQLHVPGETLETEYWLPEALEQHPYRIAGRERVSGVDCIILKRGEVDTVWIAKRNGYVVCKRELVYGEQVPFRERLFCEEIDEVAPGIWVPRRQTQQSIVMKDGITPVKLMLQLNDVAVGSVSDADMRVVIPEDTEIIEDMISGRTYRRSSGEGDPFDLGVQREREATYGQPSPTGFLWTIVGANVAIVLALVLWWFVRRRRRLEMDGGRG